MENNRVGVSGERVASPMDLVRFCRQQIETPGAYADSHRRTFPTILSAISSCGNSVPHPSLASTPDLNIDHRSRLLASTSSSTGAPSPISPPSLSGLSSVDSGEMFQGGLFNPKLNHLSPFVNDFRPNQQYQKSNTWCFQSGVNGDGSDLSFFSDNPTTMNANGQDNTNDPLGRRKASDKTPMCLIADLARYNDVPHQYKLTNEGGPAHQKIFTVSLTIGEGENQEEYIAQGASIKKAQQAAAQKALDETKLPKRPARFCHKRRPTATTYGYCSMENASLTPTVMLNSLAMKLGATPEYTFLNSPYPMVVPPRVPPPAVFHANQLRLYRGGSPSPFSTPPPTPFNPYGYPPPPLPFSRFPPILMHLISLKVGQYEFIGQGPNRQLAKHDASLKALRTLEPLLQKRDQQEKEKRLVGLENGEPKAGADSDTKQEEPEDKAADKCELDEIASDNKSPINIIYEFALRKHLDVNFEVMSETGPAHKRHFVVRCIVNGPSFLTMTTDGEGASKKAAKHDAATKMIEILKQMGSTLPAPVPAKQLQEQQSQQKTLKDKRKKATIIKDLKSDPNYGQEINPVSRLIQVQQAKKEAEPLFEYVGEDGHARCKEFIMKVTIGDKSCDGRGPNKKLAKRAAAEAMLEMMGYAKPLPTPGKPVLKHRQSSPSESPSESPEQAESPKAESEDQGNSAEKRKVKFQLSDDRTESLDDENRNGNYRFGRQRSRGARRLAPGVFFLPSAFADCDTFDDCRTTTSPANGGSEHTDFESSFGNWNETEASTAAPLSEVPPDSAKEQLSYLASLLSFQIVYTDFPKSIRNGGQGDYLSLVSLSTSPPLVCHGSGPTVQHAQNDAALGALRSLAGKGLELSDGSLANKSDDRSAVATDMHKSSNGETVSED